MNQDKSDNYIQLDQFLKWKSLVSSGGEAKHAIRSGLVQVNGEIETRRGRKLHTGDQVEMSGKRFQVELPDGKK